MANGRERLGPNVRPVHEHGGGARRTRKAVAKPFKAAPTRDVKLTVDKGDIKPSKSFDEASFRKDWLARNQAPSQYARNASDRDIRRYEKAMTDYNARWATGEYARRDELGPRPQDPRGARKSQQWYDYDVEQWNTRYKADLQSALNTQAEADLQTQQKAYQSEQKEYKEAQRRSIVGRGSSYAAGGLRGFEMLGRRFI